VHRMQKQQHPIMMVNTTGTFPGIFSNMKIAQLGLTGLQYLDKRLVFLYNEATKVFDPFLIDSIEYGPLVSSMKIPPRDVREPVLHYVIDTLPLDYYGKYRQDRCSDDLTNSSQAIQRIVRSGELSKFSFYLSEEILFISDIVNKGRLFTANWSNRPRINMSELIHLNSQFFIKFGKNIPNLALHLANILENGSSLLLLNRSTRSIKSSSELTKIERMFFWHSSIGDGVYKLYSNLNLLGKNFDLSDDSNVLTDLCDEILTDKNVRFYIRPELRSELKDKYSEIRDSFTYGPARPLHEVKIDNSRLELPGSRDTKILLDEINSEVKEKIDSGFKYSSQYTFYNCYATHNISRNGSRQIRRNLFRLVKWLHLLENVSQELIERENISPIRDKINIAKYLIFLNTIMFRTGRTDATLQYVGS